MYFQIIYPFHEKKLEIMKGINDLKIHRRRMCYVWRFLDEILQCFQFQIVFLCCKKKPRSAATASSGELWRRGTRPMTRILASLEVALVSSLSNTFVLIVPVGKSTSNSADHSNSHSGFSILKIVQQIIFQIFGTVSRWCRTLRKFLGKTKNKNLGSLASNSFFGYSWNKILDTWSFTIIIKGSQSINHLLCWSYPLELNCLGELTFYRKVLQITKY